PTSRARGSEPPPPLEPAGIEEDWPPPLEGMPGWPPPLAPLADEAFPPAWPAFPAWPPPLWPPELPDLPADEPCPLSRLASSVPVMPFWPPWPAEPAWLDFWPPCDPDPPDEPPCPPDWLEPPL